MEEMRESGINPPAGGQESNIHEDPLAQAPHSNPYLIPFSIVLAGALVAGAVIYSGGGSAASSGFASVFFLGM